MSYDELVEKIRQLTKKYNKELYTLIDEKEHTDDPEVRIRAFEIFRIVRELSKLTGDWKEIQA